MSQRNLLLLITGLVLSYVCYVRAEQNPYARYVAIGYSVIDRHSLSEIPDQALFNGAMQGMVQVLKENGDEYSGFVNQRHRQEFREDLLQEFGGVGIRFSMLGDPPIPTVISPPLEGSPAFDVNIQTADRIAAIEDKATTDMTIQDIYRSLRGPVGSTVSLRIERDDTPESIECSMVRQVITDESILGDIRDTQGNWIFRLEQSPEIAFIRIEKFADKTLSELLSVLASLSSVSDDHQPIEALILDVRDNAGGALEAAVGISDLFLRAGLPIVTTRGREGVIHNRFVSTGGSGYTEIPLVLLINQDSASASEILAACLQDHGRAVVVGQRSYGKGTVQQVIPVESGRSILKLTWATFWRPNGKTIHRMKGDMENETWGVKPNPGLEVVLNEEEAKQWRKYRSRRDVLGNPLGEKIAGLLDKQNGKLPEGYQDRALQKAIEVLRRYF